VETFYQTLCRQVTEAVVDDAKYVAACEVHDVVVVCELRTANLLATLP
jgi:hypothetical protein